MGTRRGGAGGARARAALRRRSVRRLLSRRKLGAEDGLVVLEQLLAAAPGLAVVMFTAMQTSRRQSKRCAAARSISSETLHARSNPPSRQGGKGRSLEQRVRSLEIAARRRSAGRRSHVGGARHAALARDAFKAPNAATVLILGRAAREKASWRANCTSAVRDATRRS